MSHRLLLAGGCVLMLGAPAAADTTTTGRSPEQIRAYHDSGDYAKALAKTYANATSYVKAQLKKDPAKPAVVLDIDETAMSNYGCLDAADFNPGAGLADCALNSKSVAIPSALKFYKAVRAKNVSVFFITGAPQAICDARKKNLAAQGFSGKLAVTCRTDTGSSMVPYKSGARKAIKKKGFTILANVGDQKSDLSGGHARRTFKLVNDMYVTT